MALLLLDATLRVLALVNYRVTDHDVGLSRMPTLPQAGLLVRVPATAGPGERLNA